jgi:hypothetical protein
MAHPVILTDIGNGRILVVDLDKTEPLAKENVLWEWIPTKDLGWNLSTQKFLKDALAEVKFRWSAHFQTNVVLFTSSRGSVGMIEYPSGKCLWEAMVGVSPHAIELLPNGDLIVAASGGGEGEKGRVHYLELLPDGTYVPTTESVLYGAHGIVWDPETQIVWANGSMEIVAYKRITGEDGRSGLERMPDKGVTLPNIYGHDLIQDLTDPDALWITTSPDVYQFSKSRNVLTAEFTNSDVIHPLLRAKGICNFPDGVVVWVAYGHHTSSEHPAVFSALWPEENGAYRIEDYVDAASGWNKVRVPSTDYR